MADFLEFFNLRDAYNQTLQPIGKRVFASSANLHQLAQFLFFAPITDMSGVLDYRRRAHRDRVNIPYAIPGAQINRAQDAKIVQTQSRLKTIVSQPAIASHIQANYANAPYYQANPLSPSPQPKDPLWTKAELLMQDMARTAWATAISGKWIDIATIQPGGSLTAAEITKITVGHSIDPTRGTGFLKFTKTGSKLAFKAPGDNIYGPDIVVANANTYTLYCGSSAGSVTVTTGTLPSSDGLCEIEFKSSGNTPDGLISLMEPDQIISLPAPTALLPKYLDELKLKLFPAYRESMWTVFIMHPSDLNALAEVARSYGGATFAEEDFGSLLAPVPEGLLPMAKRKLPVYRGSAIITDDTMPIKMMDGKPTRPVICVNLDPRTLESDGVDFGAFIGVVRGLPTGKIYQQYGFGWYIEPLGVAQDSTNHMMRIQLDHSWALGSSGAAAMMEGFYNPLY